MEVTFGSFIYNSDVVCYTRNVDTSCNSQPKFFITVSLKSGNPLLQFISHHSGCYYTTAAVLPEKMDPDYFSILPRDEHNGLFLRIAWDVYGTSEDKDASVEDVVKWLNSEEFVDKSKRFKELALKVQTETLSEEEEPEYEALRKRVPDWWDF